MTPLNEVYMSKIEKDWMRRFLRTLENVPDDLLNFNKTTKVAYMRLRDGQGYTMALTTVRGKPRICVGRHEAPSRLRLITIPVGVEVTVLPEELESITRWAVDFTEARTANTEIPTPPVSLISWPRPDGTLALTSYVMSEGAWATEGALARLALPRGGP